MCDEIVEVLKKSLSTFSIKFPLSTDLNCLVSRGFSLISSREAYETLRYLLNACGKVVELNENSFSDIRWKSADPDVKRRIEKCKRYVLDSIKNIRKENKMSIPNLKMSELLVPYSLKYFSTCLALANYALSYQLENHGLYFWPKSEAHPSIEMFRSNLKEEECHKFEIQQEKLLNEIDLLESTIDKLEKQMKKVNSLTDNEIAKCKYSCALQEEPERSRILANWKDEIDELHKRNSDKIKNLEDLNKQLAVLARLMVKKEKFMISGDELRKNIHFEVENFAEMNGVPLFKENHLDISALFKIVYLSIPKAIKNKEMFRELLSLKLPEIDPGLLNKLENQKKKLEERCEDFHRHFGEDNMTEASAWLKDFLFYIPKVEFNPMNSTISSRDPIFDEEKLSHFIELCEKSSHCKESNNELTARKGKGVLHRFRDFNSKYSKKKDNQTAIIKRDSKKQMWRNIRRKSISLIDISTLSPASIKSVHSEKVNSPCVSEPSQRSFQELCSTPKELINRSSFIKDKNISPISVLSNKDESFIRGARIYEIDNANDSTLNENDINSSLLNSFLSEDLDNESENNKDTFESTISSINIMLDSSLSALSINLPST